MDNPSTFDPASTFPEVERVGSSPFDPVIEAAAKDIKEHMDPSTEQREPMLSDADMGKMSVTENGSAGENKYRMGRRIRDFYETKITSGELITKAEYDKLKLAYLESTTRIKTVRVSRHRTHEAGDMPFRCEACGCGFDYRAGFYYEKPDADPLCCPGCGSRIIE